MPTVVPKSKDGDHLDVFIAEDDPASELVFVIDQCDPDTGEFDEHKVVLCTTSTARAREVYLSNYAPGWNGLKAITGMTVGQFKDWLASGDTKKPVAGIQVKAADDVPKSSGRWYTREELTPKSDASQEKAGPGRLISIKDVEEHSKAVAAKNGYWIRNSKIEGLGLHAYKAFQPGEKIMDGLMRKLPHNGVVTRYELSDEARFTNHSSNPNAEVQKNGDQVDMVAKRAINPGDEITADYLAASRRLGPLFQYYYQGEPYHGGSSTGRAPLTHGDAARPAA